MIIYTDASIKCGRGHIAFVTDAGHIAAKTIGRCGGTNHAERFALNWALELVKARPITIITDCEGLLRSQDRLLREGVTLDYMKRRSNHWMKLVDGIAGLHLEIPLCGRCF